MKPFHEMTKGEAGERLRSLYHAQPKADWDSLAVGNGDPPDGRGTWTLELLADRLVRLRQVDAVSRETVRKALKKTTFDSES